MSDINYHGPTVTVDAIVVRNNAGVLEFLLHDRPREPFAGYEALPGAYMNSGEIIQDVVDRCLADKAGFFDHQFTHTIGVSDSVARDPRGHAISIMTLSFAPMSEPSLDSARWVSYNEIMATENLAFDHADIIRNAREWIIDQLLVHPNVLRGLSVTSPELSTSVIKNAFRSLGDLDGVSNIRRRVRTSGIARETDQVVESDGPGRPGKIWEFTT